MYLATPCTLTCIWLHFVADAASRGFLVLAFRFATPCTLTSIWLHMSPTLHREVSSVSMPFVYILYFDLYLATPCDRRCIAWFPSVSMPFGYTLNFDVVTDAASRGFVVLACRLATP